jgi:hypothetical protein
MLKKNVVSMQMTNKLSAVLAAFVILSGCSKGSVTGSGGSSSLVGSITVSSVYPTSEGSSWTPIQASSRFYIKGLSVSIGGTCSRGIATLKVSESGSGGPFETEVATCLNDGSFVWTKTYTGPLEADKTLTVVAFDIEDLAIGGTATNVDVRVDNIAPAAVAVTTPATSPFTYTGASSLYSIIGTCTIDTTLITGPSGNVTPSAGSWNNTVTVIDGASTDYTYYAFDLAGNQSAGTTQTIEWSPDISLMVSGLISGARNLDSGTNYVLEGSGESQDGVTTVHGGSSFSFDAGFNYITYSARQ